MSDVLSATTQSNDSSPADAAGKGYSFSKILRIGGFILVIAALIAVTGSFAILMGFTSVSPTDEVVGIIVLVVGTLLFALFLAICWEVWTLIKARRRGRAASRLHIRIVSLFAIVAAVPALVVAIVAGITLDLGLDRWFSSRTQSIVESSVSVAQSYLSEHARFLASDMRAIARDFDRQRAAMETDQRAREVFLTTQATIRSLPGLSLVDKDGKEIAKANIRVRRDFPEVPQGAIRDAGRNQNGIPILIRPGKSGNLVGGVLSLNTFDDYYLYAIRTVDPKVVRYLQDAESNAAEYANLRGGRSGVQVAFALLYAGLALVLLVSAIWVAIAFANRLVNPIRRLIAASDQVAGGDLTTNVPVKKSDGDIGSLSQTFNTMVSGLKNQQEELISTNAQLDQRRRFTEAVLSGVTAGVLGLTSDGEIEIANSYVEAVLGTKSDALLGRRLQEAIPELDELLENAMNEIKREHQGQIALIRAGQERIINVRITAELDGVQAEGYVVTLDDITDLVNAQRSSAWADVARRIAHEIRNPLTPIQLSAERLRRRFGKDLNEKDQIVFDKCTDTIVRQVGDIGRMVDEFSSFARMPKATLAPGDLRECIREAVYLREVASPSTSFKLELSEEPMRGDYDERLISQAVGNLIKNASEALEESGLPDAKILVKARAENELLLVEIIDNGPGWPKENRNKLLEPYMTTRKKGTGLGLAIVTKVIEEHLGRVELLDAPDYEQTQRGAMVRIVLPAKPNKDDIVEENIIQEEKESIRS